jgi:hypothetical protein
MEEMGQGRRPEVPLESPSKATHVDLRLWVIYVAFAIPLPSYFHGYAFIV